MSRWREINSSLRGRAYAISDPSVDVGEYGSRSSVHGRLPRGVAGGREDASKLHCREIRDHHGFVNLFFHPSLAPCWNRRIRHYGLRAKRSDFFLVDRKLFVGLSLALIPLPLLPSLSLPLRKSARSSRDLPRTGISFPPFRQFHSTISHRRSFVSPDASRGAQFIATISATDYDLVRRRSARFRPTAFFLFFLFPRQDSFRQFDSTGQQCRVVNVRWRRSSGARRNAGDE